MKVQTISLTGTGNSSAVVVNTNVTPINIGLGFVVSGTVNYTMQVSYDDPSNFVTWFDDATVASKTANFASSISTPVSGVRFKINSGTGTVTLSAVQAGIA
jgi:hypothetical protein